jgi:hypothetical protein
MSGALSVPFAFLALFNVPGRLLFAGLAYAGLWVLIIAQARRISELQKPVPSPKVTVRVEHDLIDLANDPLWIRGEIKNEGDRGAEGCRLKLLRVEGQNIQPGRIENGALEWQGGGCAPKRLDPHERLIFDIGTRRCAENSPLVLLAFFEGNPVEYELPSSGDYTLTLVVYGENTQPTERTVRIRIREKPEDIQFTVSQPQSLIRVP